MSRKIPQSFRVTLKHQEARIADPQNPGVYITVIQPPLAYAVVYAPNTIAYNKSKKVQDKWAYGTCSEIDGKMHSHLIRYEYNTETGMHTRVRVDELVEEQLQPRIIENAPMPGFKITKSVSRYSTSNKLWRILDPRGFELEISTQCLEDLLLTGEVRNGEIIGHCVWAGFQHLVRV